MPSASRSTARSARRRSSTTTSTSASSVPTDLSALAPLLPPPLQPLVATPFPLVVKAVGSRLPIGTTPQDELNEESLTAYEVAYTGTFGDRTTLGAAFYVNDRRRQHQLRRSCRPTLDPYTAANPPPGWPLPPAILTLLAQRGIFLPRTAFTYLNLGPIRQKGLELSLDHRINRRRDRRSPTTRGRRTRRCSTIANPFPSQELALPPTNRFNVGFNFDAARLLGSAIGELLGRGVLERRADQPVPRLHRRLHDGQRQLRREVAERPG